jgi:hypothetical protein
MKKPLSLLLLLLAALTVSAQNISFKGKASGSIGTGERFHIIYTLQTDNGEQGRDINVPDVKGLQQLYGPQIEVGMNSVVVNGRSQTQFVSNFIYTYMANETGTYTIPPATLKVGNSTYKSNELKIQVVAADKSVGQGAQSQSSSQTPAQSNISNEDIFVVGQVSKRDVYENEGFLISYRLYTRTTEMNITNLQYPNFEGFITMDVDTPPKQQWDITTYNGRQYYTLQLNQWILYPVKSGATVIEPAKIEVEVLQQTPRSRTPFGTIYDRQLVKKTLNSSRTTINAKPLPPGKPASFSGAVGEYTMTSSMMPDQLKTDEVVTVKLSISGSGNIKFIKTPAIQFPNDFDELDPKTSESIRVSTSGVNGSKSIEYYGIPRYAGTYTIPGTEFSYFDLKTKTYKTLSSPAYQLQVEQGEGGSAPQGMIAGTNKEDIKYLGQDIRYIKAAKPSFNRGEYLWGGIGYWLFYIIPAVLFIVLFILFRKQAAQNANIALMRTKKANKVATKRLKEAKKFLAENNRERFYEEITRAVWGYLGDKLNMPASDLTRDNVEASLSEIGVNPDLISRFIGILDTAEFARFAPSGGHEAMDDLYNTTVSAINQMENRK